MTAEKFLAEIFGTVILILLGDGVVAGVLLAKSKAQNARLDRHHHGMGASPCSAASSSPDRSAAPTSTPP